MTKIISILIVLVVLWCGWHFYLYWTTVNNDKSDGQTQTTVLNGDNLPGMPGQFNDSFNRARQAGSKAMGAWLNVYDSQINDPRRAWIELDYVVSITRDNPPEAKRIFELVKARINESSPVWPRLKQLESTYE